MNAEEFARLEAQRDGYLSQYRQVSRKVKTQEERVAKEAQKLAELKRIQGHLYGPLCIYQAQHEIEEGLVKDD